MKTCAPPQSKPGPATSSKAPREPARLSRRLQRKCACGGTPGPTGECAECRRKRLQTKLAINQHGDQYEEEADRMAQAIVRGGASSRPILSSLGIGSVQREGAAAKSGEGSGAPPIVDEVLRSSGQPLEGATRAFMEQRFGYDFSRVRVHADARADESARAVQALAYTVGNHLVFAAGRYEQSTTAGRHLLAHELAHTIQQDPAPATGPGRTPLTTRVSRRIQRQAAPPPITPTDASVCRIHFEHARTELSDPKEFDRCMKSARGYLKGNPDTKVALYGFASEEGDTKFNEDLAQRRAETVQKLFGLGGLPRGRVLAFGRGEDKSFATLPENRRVEVVPFQKIELPKDEITVPKPKVPTHFCGPNVTKQVGDSVAKIKTDFRKLSADEKNTSCDWLRDEVYGLISWDIRPLHQQSWIRNDYGQTCAQPLGGEGVCCHRSVQIGDACHYAGSVNYVSFGAMCRECFDHYATAPVDLSGVYNFREQSMVDLIELYKGGHLPFTSRASNVENSKKWASAGYQGWPSGGSQPKADCAECAPCPTQYVGKEFDARWCPYIDPKKACPENRAQVLKEESRDARSRRGKR
jgi:outer membrane protein OmpA-like peptidoglycan-associated protein